MSSLSLDMIKKSVNSLTDVEVHELIEYAQQHLKRKDNMKVIEHLTEAFFTITGFIDCQAECFCEDKVLYKEHKVIVTIRLTEGIIKVNMFSNVGFTPYVSIGISYKERPKGEYDCLMDTNRKTNTLKPPPWNPEWSLGDMYHILREINNHCILNTEGKRDARTHQFIQDYLSKEWNVPSVLIHNDAGEYIKMADLGRFLIKSGYTDVEVEFLHNDSVDNVVLTLYKDEKIVGTFLANWFKTCHMYPAIGTQQEGDLPEHILPELLSRVFPLYHQHVRKAFLERKARLAIK